MARLTPTSSFSPAREELLRDIHADAQSLALAMSTMFEQIARLGQRATDRPVNQNSRSAEGTDQQHQVSSRKQQLANCDQCRDAEK